MLAATLLLLADVNIKAVIERLGHASVAITLHTFSHVLLSMHEKAVAAMASLTTCAALEYHSPP